MCKPVTMVLVALLLVTSSFTILSAQTPFVAVYFETVNWSETTTCPLDPPGTVFQQIFVAAVNFNTQIGGIEFQVNYPPELQWIGEFYPIPAVANGTTPTGLQLGFLSPGVDGNSVFIVASVTVLWQCGGCTGDANVPVTVGPHPLSGFVQGVDISVNPSVLIPGVGLTALICPTVPVEETTWGKVKALYAE